MRGYKVVAPMNWAAGRGVRQDKTPPNSGVGRLDAEPGSPTPVGLPGVFLAECQEMPRETILSTRAKWSPGTKKPRPARCRTGRGECVRSVGVLSRIDGGLSLGDRLPVSFRAID